MGEHGMAVWIDVGAQCVLFDAGQSSLLVHNAKRLGVEIDAVNVIALSHGHYDHVGGIADVLALAGGKVDVHAHPCALLPKYHRSSSGVRDIGVPAGCIEAIHGRAEFHDVTAPCEIAAGVFLTGEVPRNHAEEQVDEGFCVDAAGRQPDNLQDDQSIFLKTRDGTVVLLGCAHAGVVNTLDYICKLTENQPILAVMGGMHLHNASDERIAWTVDCLRRFSVRTFYPAHCTGQRAVLALSNAFPGRCLSFGVGTVVTL